MWKMPSGPNKMYVIEANWRYRRSRYKQIQLYRTDLQEVSGSIRIKLRKLFSGQNFFRPPVKFLPVRLWVHLNCPDKKQILIFRLLPIAVSQIKLHKLISASFHLTTSNQCWTVVSHVVQNCRPIIKLSTNYAWKRQSLQSRVGLKLYAHGMRPMRFLSACVWFRDVTSFPDASGGLRLSMNLLLFWRIRFTALTPFTRTQIIPDVSEKDVTSRNQKHASKKRTGRMPCASSLRCQNEIH